jgi:hypothetical protein
VGDEEAFKKGGKGLGVREREREREMIRQSTKEPKIQS